MARFLLNFKVWSSFIVETGSATRFAHVPHFLCKFAKLFPIIPNMANRTEHSHVSLLIQLFSGMSNETRWSGRLLDWSPITTSEMFNWNFLWSISVSLLCQQIKEWLVCVTDVWVYVLLMQSPGLDCLCESTNCVVITELTSDDETTGNCLYFIHSTSSLGCRWALKLKHCLLENKVNVKG